MVKKMMLVALWCIQMKPTDRPSMSKVIEMLEGNIEQLHTPPKPFLYSQSMQVENNGMNNRNSNLSGYVISVAYLHGEKNLHAEWWWYLESKRDQTRIVVRRKMYDVQSVPIALLVQPDDLELKWPQRVCGKCEAVGMFCRFKSDSTSDEFECFNPIEKGELLIASVTLVSFVLLVILIQKYRFHRQKKIKRKENLKIERFLEDYRALKPARYSYADIKKIENQFKDKVGQGGYGIVYRRQLSNDIHVAVKILNNTKGNGEEFINEVGIIGTIHHINVVHLVGYCADGFRRALIYEFLPNGSLEKFASSDHDKYLLGWKKLQEIAMGIAKGIEYLHQGCDQQILHFDSKPHNILLDENLNPKITDFGQAKLCSKEQSVVSMTTARGTIGYIAPKHQPNLLSEWIYNRLDGGEEVGIRIQDEGDAKIAKKLTIVGLWCIQWYPIDRPSMHVAACDSNVGRRRKHSNQASQSICLHDSNDGYGTCK
ncbi:hypothetical protein Vadar_004867 [Vaccinium darrowii]|uniref:Uncharacterized protein n=1 Tax=Vaccinium darrowii TaxID=229202 RepID=A0ACB7YLC7_9ERIC|nr:hypothetical protein Vadar_004867 [Vaccinium darrowii]